jgi:hypothetical protein
MLLMSSGAGEITHTSDLTSVKYLVAVKRRLREKNMFEGVFIHFLIMFSIMGTKFSKLEWLTLQCIWNYLLVNPGAIRSTYPILKVFLVQLHLYSLLPLPVLNPVITNLQGKNVFLQNKLPQKQLIFFFFRQIAFLICWSSFKKVVK